MIEKGKYIFSTPIEVDGMKLNVYTAAVSKSGEAKAYSCDHIPVRD